MKDMIKWAAGLALAAAASSAPAVAAKGRSDSAASDPQREICKSQSVVGSRLKRVRVCMTALEWEELKLQEQIGLTRKQINGNGGCGEGVCPVGRDTPW